MPRLSLIVIARNEETSILRCLRSATIADEIVVLLNDTTDQTAALARSAGARVIEVGGWPGFGPQKQRALDAATGEWVLSLDADEWIEAALIREIQSVLTDPNAADGYEMPRRNRFAGTIVNHGGWSPDYVLRLFRKSKARFSGDLVHERAIVRGRIARLKSPIEHDTIAGIADAEEKAARYAGIAARELAARGATSSPLKARIRGAAAYLRSYVFQLGFLDGQAGLNVARYNASYTYQKWAGLAAIRAGKSAP